MSLRDRVLKGYHPSKDKGAGTGIAPDSNFTNTNALIQVNEGATSIVDHAALEAATSRIITQIGVPTIVSDSTVRYGTKALRFVRTLSQGLLIRPAADFAVLANQKMAIQFWFYPTSLPGDQYLVGSFDASTDGTYGLRLNPDGSLSLRIQNGGTINSTRKLQIGKLHHVELDRDASRFYLFIDGFLQGTLDYPGALACPDFYVGCRSGTTDFADGVLDGLQFIKGNTLHTAAFDNTPASGGTPTEPPMPTTGTRQGWSVSGNQIIDGAGVATQFTGVNFFGCGTLPNGVPLGQAVRTYKNQLSHIRQLGFNAVRIPFADPTVNSTATITSAQAGLNTDLIGKTPLEALELVVNYCESIGLFVVLAHYRSNWDGTQGEYGTQANGLWYETRSAFGITTAQNTVDTWVKLATRLKGKMCVVGADLHHEPYTVTGNGLNWGSTGNAANDWKKFCEDCGNAIHAVNPDWLIIVEGVDNNPTTNANYSTAFVGYGGAIQHMRTKPITLTLANKVVYSPHFYGPEVNPSFVAWADAAYPESLAAKWFDPSYGTVYWDNLAPLICGEFGALLDNGDTKATQFHDKALRYMGGERLANGVNNLTAGKRGVSWFRYTWDPYDVETGGILSNANDFTTVSSARLNPLLPWQYKGVIAKPVTTPVTTPPPDPGTDPGTGTTPVWPYDKPTTTNNRYVSTSGNNANDGLTAGTAWRTIQYAASNTPAGTTVWVAPGTYTENVSQTTNGTSTNPIVFISTNLWQAKIQAPSGSTGTIVDSRGNYVHWLGFEVSGTGSSKRGGIWIAGTNARVAWCNVHNISESNNNVEGGAIMGEWFYGNLNQIVEYNHVWRIGATSGTSSNMHGIYMTGTGVVRGNLIYQCAGVGIHGWHGPRNLTVVNNTVNARNSGILIGLGDDPYGYSGTLTGCVIRNNIIVNAQNVGFWEINASSGNVSSHNLYYNNAQNYLNESGTGSGNTNALTANPLFVDSAANDYRLQSTSPAINSGTATNAAPLDLDGYTRPQGTGIDRGAYERRV